MELCGAQLGLIMTMRGLTPTFGKLDHLDYTETETERRFIDNPNLVFAEFYYWTRKSQASFIAGDGASAAAASLKADRLVWTSTAQFETAEHRYYGALAHALAAYGASNDDKLAHLASLKDHHRQLQIWAVYSPATFENRAAIAAAEIARIEGRELDAEVLYEKAIESARENGFVHNEAFANEMAGRFHAARGFEKIATMYLREARACYLRWGADAKVRQLDTLHPHLRLERASTPTETISAPVEHLDLATVIKVSNAVSGEIVLESLIDTLMRTALEHAGAERAVLLLPLADDYRIEAEATTRDGDVAVDLRGTLATAADLPHSVLRYVARTRDALLLHDASREAGFSTDVYLRDRGARSVLCLPILKQARLLGVLYLENSLTSHAFAPAHVAILKLLASETASSMENARLYRDLAERESRIRRLVDANIIGIIIWDLRGRILEANDAFLRMVGYDRDDLVVLRNVSWTGMTPPEWRERDEQLVTELLRAGTLQPFEKEFYRKDGSRVPVLIGVATFEGGGYQGVGFVLDLTERKRAINAMRELQAELAHANRVSTMGQLTASIAHEVNQPIGAARNNAHAALRFLAADPPNLAEVREALECVVNETYRADEIIGRIRDQVKKSPPRSDTVDLNAAIRDVMALVHGELGKQRVIVDMQLADELPAVRGDRVQLQQVMLNLVLNAIEAMSGNEEGERSLAITTERDSTDGLRVAVCDSGPGIDAGDRERIFDSFYTTKPNGVGIGLSICRSIVESHGGRLWADSQSTRGAGFRFTLPSERSKPD
jgi:PAS domain S-box-containing protein